MALSKPASINFASDAPVLPQQWHHVVIRPDMPPLQAAKMGALLSGRYIEPKLPCWDRAGQIKQNEQGLPFTRYIDKANELLKQRVATWSTRLEVLSTVPQAEKALLNAIKRLGAQNDIRVMFCYHAPQRQRIPEICFKPAEPAPHLHLVIENNSGEKLHHYPAYRSLVRASKKVSFVVRSNTFPANRLRFVLAYLKKEGYFYLGTNCSAIGMLWRSVPKNSQQPCTDEWDPDSSDDMDDGDLGSDMLTGTGLVQLRPNTHTHILACKHLSLFKNKIDAQLLFNLKHQH